MKTVKPLILFGLCSMVPPVAFAQQEMPDVSKWQCNLCKFEQGASGSIEAGAGNVSNGSAKFGDYTGLNEKGGYFIGEATSRYRGADGMYWNVRASDIGLDSRSASLEGGRQGAYRLFLDSDAIPRYTTETARTPFLGSGGTVLALPAGFPAASTGLMPLAATLQPAELESKRTRLGLGASWLPIDHWQFDVGYRRDTKDGTKRASGAFFVTAAQMVEPMSSVTDQVDISASYSRGKLQARFAYYASRFRNDVNSLTWQNPFTIPAFPGALAGQLAAAPDNQFHQFSASVGYQFTDRTRASADFAWGRMTQDDGFLAPTLNATLAVPALPGASLNARAKTLNANVRVNSRITDDLRVNASYSRDERDNQTRQAVYPWVTTDLFLALPRTNLPYSFEQDRLKLSADYRISPLLRAAAGLDQDWRKYTFQQFRKTDETAAWAKANWRALENLDLSLKLAGSERRNSGYQAVDPVVPPENPLLRIYSLANRSRETVAVRADLAATEAIQVGLGINTSKDRYRDTSIGLTNGREYSLNGDVSAMLTEQTSVNLFANHQVIRSSQAGSQAFANPDWSAENRDTVDVLGVGLKHGAIKNKLDLGADFVYTRTRGAIRVDAGVSDPPFPDFTTTMHGLKLYFTYRVDAQWSVNGGYWHERYRSANWMLDGVAPATVPNLLTFGEQAPQYRVNVVRLSARYSF